MNILHEFNIPESIIVESVARCTDIKFDPSRSLNRFGSEKKRLIEGYIGEACVMKELGISTFEDDFEYDLMYKDQRLEVKTISCKFKPLPNYLATVNSCKDEGMRKQDSDFYVFVRILNDYSKGWILGFYPCSDFFEQGEYVEKGKDFGKFKFVKANATVLPISELYQFKKFKDEKDNPDERRGISSHSA